MVACEDEEARAAHAWRGVRAVLRARENVRTSAREHVSDKGASLRLKPAEGVTKSSCVCPAAPSRLGVGVRVRGRLRGRGRGRGRGRVRGRGRYSAVSPAAERSELERSAAETIERDA